MSLRERVARAITARLGGHYDGHANPGWRDDATVAAIAIVLEEAAKVAEEITRLRTVEAELKHLKETEGIEWLSTPTIDRLQDAEDRAIKAERERDEAVERVQILELRLEGKP